MATHGTELIFLFLKKNISPFLNPQSENITSNWEFFIGEGGGGVGILQKGSVTSKFILLLRTFGDFLWYFVI